MGSSSDIFSHYLRAFRLNTEVFLRGRFCGKWRLDHSPSGRATFHLVVDGQCWLHRLDHKPPTRLSAGDLLILPRDAPHVLSSSSCLPRVAAVELRALADVSAGGTGILCGHFQFDDSPHNPFLDTLPDYLLIATHASPTGPLLHRTIRLLLAEAESEALGFEVAVDRLADVLFIQALREYLAQVPQQTGFVAAANDPVLRRVLYLMHEQLHRPWTLNTLAREAAVSRSGLAQRFPRLMGMTPMKYLTDVRMHHAYHWLEQGASITLIAERCGYATEAGFSKAFKRYHKVAPGEVRRTARKKPREESKHTIF